MRIGGGCVCGGGGGGGGEENVPSPGLCVGNRSINQY